MMSYLSGIIPFEHEVEELKEGEVGFITASIKVYLQYQSETP